MIKFRPWGHVYSLLQSMPEDKWNFYGCISSEDRALTSFQFVNSIINVETAFFCAIEDPKSCYTDLIKKECEFKSEFLLDRYSQVKRIIQFSLFEPIENVKLDFEKFISCSCGKVILDISCLPKRFFFPFVKFLSANSLITDVVITNTIPNSYSSTDIASDFDYWSTLPLFAGADTEEPPEQVIISVGHLPMSLHEAIVNLQNTSQVHLLLPFPGTVSSVNLTWKFVKKIEDHIGRSRIKIHHINARDSSLAFDTISTITDSGSRRCIMAPYGPKPISLAIALHSCRHDIPVFYTQPKMYHPRYSKGVSQTQGWPLVLSYVIKSNGDILY